MNKIINWIYAVAIQVVFIVLISSCSSENEPLSICVENLPAIEEQSFLSELDSINTVYFSEIKTEDVESDNEGGRASVLSVMSVAAADAYGAYKGARVGIRIGAIFGGAHGAIIGGTIGGVLIGTGASYHSYKFLSRAENDPELIRSSYLVVRNTPILQDERETLVFSRPQIDSIATSIAVNHNRILRKVSGNTTINSNGLNFSALELSIINTSEYITEHNKAISLSINSRLWDGNTVADQTMKKFGEALENTRRYSWALIKGAQSYIKAIEENTEFTDEEKNALLIAVSVGVYSAKYWDMTYVN